MLFECSSIMRLEFPVETPRTCVTSSSGVNSTVQPASRIRVQRSASSAYMK